MKKNGLLLLTLFCLTFTSFGQTKDDSLSISGNKDGNIKKKHYKLGLGAYSSKQLDLTFGVLRKRHIFEIGIIYGPTFLFSLHEKGSYDPNYDYLILYKMDFRKFSLHGVDISYQYVLSSKRHFEQKMVSLFEFSEYKGYYWKQGFTPDPYPTVFIKRQLHALIGYNFSFEMSKKLGLGLSFLSGIKYYWDKEILDPDLPQSNPPGPREYSWEKMLPSFLIKFGITYKL